MDKKTLEKINKLNGVNNFKLFTTTMEKTLKSAFGTIDEQIDGLVALATESKASKKIGMSLGVFAATSSILVACGKNNQNNTVENNNTTAEQLQDEKKPTDPDFFRRKAINDSEYMKSFKEDLEEYANQEEWQSPFHEYPEGHVYEVEQEQEVVSEEQIQTELELLNEVYNSLVSNSEYYKSATAESVVYQGNGIELNVLAAMVFGFNENVVSEEARYKFLAKHFSNEEDLIYSIYESSLRYVYANANASYDRDGLYVEMSQIRKLSKHGSIPTPDECLVEGGIKVFDEFNELIQLNIDNSLYSASSSEKEAADIAGKIIYDEIYDGYGVDEYMTRIYCAMLEKPISSEFLTKAYEEEEFVKIFFEYDIRGYAYPESYDIDEGKFFKEIAEKFVNELDLVNTTKIN